ncbi:hypothetical protein E4U60_005697 [Claviceps pazoutovae]|uniref:Uncharacterized protein n=1 Tax=Claviceps pazoutovae TaxID=1649127 RepID=A0A9P7MG83_9HYPO|nr:hypothetical protein E4U60_005697 [Claviceps pazoutovae]
MPTARIDGSFGRDGSDWKLQASSTEVLRNALHCAICNYAPKGGRRRRAAAPPACSVGEDNIINHYEAGTLLSLALEHLKLEWTTFKRCVWFSDAGRQLGSVKKDSKQVWLDSTTPARPMQDVRRARCLEPSRDSMESQHARSRTLPTQRGSTTLAAKFSTAWQKVGELHERKPPTKGNVPATACSGEKGFFLLLRTMEFLRDNANVSEFRPL